MEAEGRPSLNFCLQHYGCGTDCMVCKCKKKRHSIFILIQEIFPWASAVTMEKKAVPRRAVMPSSKLRNRNKIERFLRRCFFVFFFMHKLTHHPKRRGGPPEWFIKFLQCTQSTHSSNSPLTSPVISLSLLAFPRAHTERLKQWARQRIPTRGEMRRAISDNRFRKSSSDTVRAERLNGLWYRWLYGKSADRSDLRPGSKIRRVSWARLCDPSEQICFSWRI